MELSGAGETEVEPPEYSSSRVKKARLNSTLTALLDDPILSDVPKNPRFSDVDTLISLELGSAMRVSVLKLDGNSIGIYFLFGIFTSSLCAELELTVTDFFLCFRCGGDELCNCEGFEIGCSEKDQ